MGDNLIIQIILPFYQFTFSANQIACYILRFDLKRRHFSYFVAPNSFK